MKSSSDALAAMRIPQWSKNLLVFLPAFVSHSFDRETLINSVLAFVAFSLAASATYVINDLNDRVSDRNHDQKRHRVFADNQLEPSTGYAMIAALMAMSGFVAMQLPWQFGVVLLIYIAGSIAYTLMFKRMLGFDVVVIACLYVLRIIAGDEAIGAQFEGIDSSNWILAFSCVFFLSLAMVKRCSELSSMKADTRMPGRAYRAEDYPVMIAFAAGSAMASIVILMRYIDSNSVAENFSRPETLWLVVPILVYWQVRMVLLANRGKIVDDPVVFTLKDSKSQICTLASAAVTLAAW